MNEIFELRASYREWKKMGCQVLKGQKGLAKGKYGAALFEIWQTIPKHTMEYYENLDKLERECYDDFEMIDQESHH
jgi:hypothetical protein